MFMKKIRYLFSIILISACNYKDNESNDPYDKGLFVPENFKQLTLDSLKPPKVIIAGTPQLVDVPIKKGNSYFYKFKDGENKNIPLNPPSNIIIPKGFTQGSPNFTNLPLCFFRSLVVFNATLSPLSIASILLPSYLKTPLSLVPNQMFPILSSIIL